MASIIWFGLGLLTGIFVSQNYGDQVPDAKEMVQKVLSEVRPRPPEEHLAIVGGRDERAASLLAPTDLVPLPSRIRTAHSTSPPVRLRATHAGPSNNVSRHQHEPLTHPFSFPFSFPTTIDSYLRAFASSPAQISKLSDKGSKS
jgi:hypothetical protein